MSQKIVVGFDGSDGSNRALDFAIGRAKAQGASIVITHVLEWSPYTFLTPKEIEERHVRRQQELKRAEEALLKPVVDRLSDAGVSVETVLKYGNIGDTLCTIAEEQDALQVVVGRNGDSSRLTSRLFGSVAGNLAQSCPVPVTIVP